MRTVQIPKLTGRTLEEVLRMQMDFVPGGHWHVRVIKRNGVPLIHVGEQEMPDRINLEVEKGVVVAQSIG